MRNAASFCHKLNLSDEHTPGNVLFWQAYTHFLLENTVAAIIAVDRLGHVTIFNRHAEHTFGIASVDALGRELKQVLSVVADQEHYLLQALQNGHELKDTEHSYCPYTKQEGSFIHNVALLRLPNGQVGGAIWMRKDISAIRLFQKEVRLAEVEALVWQMAAGTAHEIRNPLASARGYIQLTQQLHKEHKKLAEYLDMAVEEIDEATRTISNFLALVRPQKEKLQVASLNELTEEVLLMVEKVAAMSDIKLSCSLDTLVPPTTLDTRQVKNALLSVLNNALQAMPQGGNLKIETLYNDSHEEISVAVSDTGVGIPAENLRQVSRPLFSTKQASNGLGLTLTTRILQHHNGRVEVESELSQGTTVRLFFPLNNNLPDRAGCRKPCS